MDVYVEDGKVVEIEGHTENGKSRGLCAKGAASKQYLYNEERILFPMKRVGEREADSSSGFHGGSVWLIAKKLSGIRKEYGAKSVVFYAGYPKCTGRLFCVLPMPLVRRIFVLNRAPVSRHLPWHGSLYMGMGSVSRICRIRRRCFCGRVIFSIPIPQWGKCYRSLKKRGVTIIAVDREVPSLPERRIST